MQAYDQHLNMVLGDVEETVTTVEIDEETFEEIIKASRRLHEPVHGGDGAAACCVAGSRHRLQRAFQSLLALRHPALHLDLSRRTSVWCPTYLSAATESSSYHRRYGRRESGSKSHGPFLHAPKMPAASPVESPSAPLALPHSTI